MIVGGESCYANKDVLFNTSYAVNEKSFDKKLLKNELIDPEKQVVIELWAYDPKIFSKDKIADGISVVLSFNENSDERIEEAVDELIERELLE